LQHLGWKILPLVAYKVTLTSLKRIDLYDQKLVMRMDITNCAAAIHGYELGNSAWRCKVGNKKGMTQQHWGVLKHIKAKHPRMPWNEDEERKLRAQQARMRPPCRRLC
jgi:hypothetical protein